VVAVLIGLGEVRILRVSGAVVVGFVVAEFLCLLIGFGSSAMALGRIRGEPDRLRGQGLAVAGLVLSLILLLLVGGLVYYSLVLVSWGPE